MGFDSPLGYKEKRNEMTTRREKSKTQSPQQNRLHEAIEPEKISQQGVNQRQEKFANFLIDVSKYVLTGVIITSLFNDVSDKTILYVVGMGVVFVTLLLGLSLTNKRKDK